MGRPFQFSMRSLFLLVTAICVAAWAYRNQDALGQAMQDTSGLMMFAIVFGLVAGMLSGNVAIGIVAGMVGALALPLMYMLVTSLFPAAHIAHHPI